ncbi:MAG: hypothetical protein LBF78_11995 [Treponema sp.]|jgi:5,10-methylene-tetrahydrofolate dehydrogenase/methenyl tetrahydrofolate cyclohydrolase|nr:hypothetical protein [Treponema sp.]
MAELLNGAPVVEALNKSIAREVAELAGRGIIPNLAIVRIGERQDDIAYERGAAKRCSKTGVQVRQVLLPADVTQDRLIDELQKLNADKLVHGILLFRPLPKGIDDNAVRNTIAPSKDIDGITDLSLAGVFTGRALCPETTGIRGTCHRSRYQYRRIDLGQLFFTQPASGYVGKYMRRRYDWNCYVEKYQEITVSRRIEQLERKPLDKKQSPGVE